jgi:hypothetical protein
LPLSTIFLLDIRTVPTLWYFFVFHFIALIKKNITLICEFTVMCFNYILRGTSIRSGGIELVLWAQISSTKGSKTYYLYLTFLNMFANKNGREKNRRGNEITLRFTTGHIFYLIIF